MLPLDLALWADLIICDYNHLFDPRAYLKRFFLEGGGNHLFLIDEAHNLLDRARDIYSADLDRRSFRVLNRALGDPDRRIATKLAEIDVFFSDLGKRCKEEAEGTLFEDEPPHGLLSLLQDFLDPAESALSTAPAEHSDLLFDRYFATLTFMRVAELFDTHYVSYAEHRGRNPNLRLFCRDPSRRIAEALQRGSTSIFFSATLTPLEYFRQVLGGNADDGLLDLGNPFPKENLQVMLADGIETTFRKRATTCGDVTECIPGNYMAYFAPFRYIEAVVERFAAAHPTTHIAVRRSKMLEAERSAFLRLFDETSTETLVGFAVMGGIFSEGINLVGERLVGAVIVGVGLHQICLERDLVRNYYDAGGRPGFEIRLHLPGHEPGLASGMASYSVSGRPRSRIVD